MQNDQMPDTVGPEYWSKWRWVSNPSASLSILDLLPDFIVAICCSCTGRKSEYFVLVGSCCMLASVLQYSLFFMGIVGRYCTDPTWGYSLNGVWPGFCFFPHGTFIVYGVMAWSAKREVRDGPLASWHKWFCPQISLAEVHRGGRSHPGSCS